MRHGATLQVGAEPYPGYRLVRPRGSGGFSEVWEANADNGSPIALKFMPSANSSANGRELRAVRAVCKLQHPNLIRVTQVWCQPGYLVIAMELADGSLLELLEAYQAERGTAVEIDLLLDYIRQAAEVLDFLNSRRHEFDGRVTGFQHCDVKPSNLLMLGRTLKLADFGLAMPTASAMTGGPRAGTLDYAAPEIFRGQLSDRSDQFALAVTYYQLRTGRFPFPETPARFDRGFVRPDPDLNPLPLPERSIVGRALSPIPLQRWPNCREFIHRLGVLFSATTGETLHDHPEPTTKYRAL